MKQLKLIRQDARKAIGSVFPNGIIQESINVEGRYIVISVYKSMREKIIAALTDFKEVGESLHNVYIINNTSYNCVVEFI